MTKNELEARKITAGSEKFGDVLELIKYFIGCVTFAFSLWIIFFSLEKMLQFQSSDGIGAIAKVFQAINMGSILGYIFGGIGVFSWNHERQGKKRAIKEKNKFQKLVEDKDGERMSSGLDETGGTPKG